MGNQSSIVQEPYTIPNVFVPSKIKSYPVLSQIEYKGIRCYARLIDDRVSIQSYLGNDLSGFSVDKLLLPILENLRDHYPPDYNIVLICTHLLSLGPDKPTLVVYDASLPGSFSYRWNILSEYVHNIPSGGRSIELVDYSIHDNLQSIQNEYERVREEGHEGLLIRDPRTSYIGGYTDTVLEY